MHCVGNLNNLSVSFYCMYFFNVVRHHIIFIYNTKQPISVLTFCEVLQKKLKVWVKCDCFEALHIEMHVHTSNLNTSRSHMTKSKLESVWEINAPAWPIPKGLTLSSTKVQTPYHDNDLILTPIISPQSGWHWPWSCPELHMGGFRDGGWQFLTFERCH